MALEALDHAQASGERKNEIGISRLRGKPAGRRTF